MMSWLLPPNKSASVTLPVGPLKTYSFSTLTQGSLRRCRFNASRSFENFFSFSRSLLRAPSHSCCETTLRFSTPRTVLILGMAFSFVLLRILFKLWQRGIHLVPQVRVGCPHIHLRAEPAWIIQTRGSDRGDLRGRVGVDHDWPA